MKEFFNDLYRLRLGPLSPWIFISVMVSAVIIGGSGFYDIIRSFNYEKLGEHELARAVLFCGIFQVLLMGVIVGSYMMAVGLKEEVEGLRQTIRFYASEGFRRHPAFGLPANVALDTDPGVAARSVRLATRDNSM